MRHNAARRSATRAGFPPPPPVVYSVIGQSESGYTLDDVTWIGATLPLTLHSTTWNDYCFGSKGLIAVGDGNFIAFSKTGMFWEAIAAPVNGKSWVGAAYSPTLDLYMIVASDGTVYRTSDPEGSWTSGGTLPGGLTVSGLFWADDRFVLYAILGTNRMRYSLNGTTWTNVTESGIGNGLNIGMTKCDDGRYVVGQNGNFRHTTNSNMTSWVNVTVSGAGQLRHVVDTPTRIALYTPGTSIVYRYLKSNPASGAGHNMGTNRNLVGKGHYRAVSNRLSILLGWTAFPTRHVRFDPSASGIPSWEYIDRGVAEGATILCSTGN